MLLFLSLWSLRISHYALGPYVFALSWLGYSYGIGFSMSQSEVNVSYASYIKYDSGSAPGRYARSDGTGELTDPFGTVGTDSGRHYSIYATYTDGGRGTVIVPRQGFINMATISPL